MGMGNPLLDISSEVPDSILEKYILGCQLTVGSDDESNTKYPYAGAAGAIKSLGATHTVCEPNKVCIDKENKIVSSCAYMYDGLPHEIDDSVHAMVDGVLSLM